MWTDLYTEHILVLQEMILKHADNITTPKTQIIGVRIQVKSVHAC